MLLSGLHVQNFRSLYEVNLELKPLTIIIGPNASGKSNLFKALEFLYDAVAGDRQEWQAYDAQIDDLVWYGVNEFGNRPNTLTLTCDFTRARERLAKYHVQMACGDYLAVAQESLQVCTDGHLHPYFTRQEERIQWYVGRRGRPLKRPYRGRVRSARTLTLRDEGPDFQHMPRAYEVYRHIVGWRFLNVNLDKARQPSFIPQYPDSVPPLADDASNLSAFLYALWRLQPDDYGAIVDLLVDLVDLPERLVVEHDAERGGQNARYVFIERPFGEAHPVPPQSISDGTIRLLAYLALLFGDRSAHLAVLEEPDRGLHPRLMHYLADVLREAVADEGGGIQVLITTHSAEFMDCFNLEEEKDYLQVYVTERDSEGRTLFIPTSAREFAPWLEKYRLGEAVRRDFV